jgi:hypothetical protein
MSGDMRQDRGACVEMTRTVAKVWPPDEKYQVFTKVPQRGVCLHLSSRGSLVICPARETSYIYRDVGWKLIIHPDCFPILFLCRLDLLHDSVENQTSGCL